MPRLLFVICYLLFSLCAAAQAQQPQPPRPVFETKTELVLVDVNVVDRDARPVPTLAAGDFQLEVNGQPRPIASVQFISTTPGNVTPSTPREAASSSNDTTTTGRLLLFVVDESSLRVVVLNVQPTGLTVATDRSLVGARLDRLDACDRPAGKKRQRRAPVERRMAGPENRALHQRRAYCFSG